MLQTVSPEYDLMWIGLANYNSRLKLDLCSFSLLETQCILKEFRKFGIFSLSWGPLWWESWSAFFIICIHSFLEFARCSKCSNLKDLSRRIGFADSLNFSSNVKTFKNVIIYSSDIGNNYYRYQNNTHKKW